MKQKEMIFQFKGSRTYIQGTDMFNAMVSRVDDAERIRFSVHGFVNIPACILHESDKKGSIDALADVRARCQFSQGGKVIYRALTESPDYSEAAERCAYDEDAVVALMDCKGEQLFLHAESPYSFIETIVAMNKQHLQSLFPDAPGKWVFTRIDLTKFCEARADLGLLFKHNMNYRLTKSDILVCGEKIGDIYFSLVKS